MRLKGPGTFRRLLEVLTRVHKDKMGQIASYYRKRRKPAMASSN
jgi:hypothetical protein